MNLIHTIEHSGRKHADVMDVCAYLLFEGANDIAEKLIKRFDLEYPLTTTVEMETREEKK